MKNIDLEAISSTILMLANEEEPKRKIKLLLQNIFATYEKEGYNNKSDTIIEGTGTVPLFFSEAELRQMPVKIAALFSSHKTTAKLRQKSGGVFEIRCRINSESVEASSKNLKKAKQKFIKKAKEISSKKTANCCEIQLFNEYLMRWLETSKKPFIKDNTYRDYISIIKLHIIPYFEKRHIKSIKYMELQDYLNNIQKTGHYRTARKIYQILCNVFEIAVADRIIPISPMLKIRLQPYETKKGVSLTRQEEAFLVNELIHSPNIYKQAFIFMLFTGIRRAELETVQVDGGWITVITAKQRKGIKEKSRQIPISPMLKQYINKIDITAIKNISPHLLTKHLHLLLPNHHCHELRHTFVTRAQECGIKREYVSLWVGHKADNSITSNIYTHLEQNKELQEQEIKKYQYTYIPLLTSSFP